MNLKSALRTRASAITTQMNRNSHFTALNMGVRPPKFKRHPPRFAQGYPQMTQMTQIGLRRLSRARIRASGGTPALQADAGPLVPTGRQFLQFGCGRRLLCVQARFVVFLSLQ